MWGLPLQSVFDMANGFYLVAGGIAIVSTAVALLASWLIYQSSARLSEQKDRELAAFQSQAARDTARLNSEAERARAEQERLHGANVEIQAQLERERAERQQIGATVNKLLPRRLTSNQTDHLKTILSNLPSTYVVVIADGSCSDCGGYADDLFYTLSAAGWVVTRSVVLGPSSTSATGLAVQLDNASVPTAAATKLVQAFQGAGILHEMMLVTLEPPNNAVLLVTAQVRR